MAWRISRISSTSRRTRRSSCCEITPEVSDGASSCRNGAGLAPQPFMTESAHSDITKLYEHIDEIEIAMMTTRRADGHLQSRAMATQRRAAGADLWFVSMEGTGKLADIAADPHVGLSYYKDRTREWISVSGIASI